MSPVKVALSTNGVKEHLIGVKLLRDTYNFSVNDTRNKEKALFYILSYCDMSLNSLTTIGSKQAHLAVLEKNQDHTNRKADKGHMRKKLTCCAE